MQLVLQHFCKTDWKAIAFYHPRSNLSYNKQGFQVGKTHNIAIQLVLQQSRKISRLFYRTLRC